MTLFFYGFATLIIVSAIMVVLSRDPVHAVLWLIFTFCNCSGLMLLLGAEFIAMMLVIIYVGAIAVLFLFVVMMLNTKKRNDLIKERLSKSKKALILCVTALLLLDFMVVVLLSSTTSIPKGNIIFAISPEIGNVHSIGRLLYTEFILPFQTSGVILFVAMIASITLTLRSRSGIKKQLVSQQLSRNKENSLIITKSDGRSGLNNVNYDD